MGNAVFRPKITDRFVDGLKSPATGDKWYRDPLMPGFSVRVYADSSTGKGAKVYGVTVAADGREKYIKIGRHGDWTATKARKEAGEIRRNFEAGLDLFAHRKTVSLFTVGSLFEEWKADGWKHLEVATKDRYQSLWDRFVPAWFRSKLLSQVKLGDIHRIHEAVSKGGIDGQRIQKKNLKKFTSKPSPIQGNRTVAMLSSMFAFKMAKDEESRDGLKGNPCPSRKKLSPERKREVWLNRDQQFRLKTFLESEENRRPDGLAAWRALKKQPSARQESEDGANPGRFSSTALNIILLIYHTGLRHWEALELTWDKVNLDRGFLLVPVTKTGPRKPGLKKFKKVRITPPARDLILSLPSLPPADPKAGWVFPNLDGCGHWVNIQDTWEKIREIINLPEDVRIHDLRHTLASDLIASGLDGSEVQAFMGWESRVSADRYIHAMEEAWAPLVDQVTQLRGMNPNNGDMPRFKIQG